MAAPPSNYTCVAQITLPGEVKITESLQQNFRTGYNKTTKARYKDKRLGIAERVNLAAWNVRLAHKVYELESELRQ